MNHPVQFVSLGPGDPETISLKAWRALQSADVICCPATSDGDGTHRSRAASLLDALSVKAPRRQFTLPMKPEREAVRQVYEEMYGLARSLQAAGRRVVVAVEGDAGVYASVHYVLERLEAAPVPVEQISGIPSFIAAAGEARLSLMQQEERLVVLPGCVTAAEMDDYLRRGHVVVIMKLSRCAAVVKEYIRLHPACSYYYFENVGTPRSLCLREREQILARKMPYFSLLIVRKEEGPATWPDPDSLSTQEE